MSHALLALVLVIVPATVVFYGAIIIAVSRKKRNV